MRPKALTSSGASKSQLFDGLDDDEPSLTNGAFVPRYTSARHAAAKLNMTVRMPTGNAVRFLHRKSIKKLVLKNLNNSQYSSPLNKESDDLASPSEYPQNGHRSRHVPIGCHVSESQKCNMTVETAALIQA